MSKHIMHKNQNNQPSDLLYTLFFGKINLHKIFISTLLKMDVNLQSEGGNHTFGGLLFHKICFLSGVRSFGHYCILLDTLFSYVVHTLSLK